MGQTVRQRGRQAAPLAATQDTSGEERQDPCPVLQPLAQPTGHLQLPSDQQLIHCEEDDRETERKEMRESGRERDKVNYNRSCV